MSNLRVVKPSLYKSMELGLPSEGRLFGSDVPAVDSSLIILSVPLDATASYGLGASETPVNIIEDSTMLDFEDSFFPQAYRFGIAMEDPNADIKQMNADIKSDVDRLRQGERGVLQSINDACLNIHNSVEKQADIYIQRGQFVGLLGGDHSACLGLVQSLAKVHESFSIVHIDAHHDLRDSYESMTYSHASIMHNIMKLPEVCALHSVGIRDYSKEESDRASEDKRIQTWYDHDIQANEFRGGTFHQLCEDILTGLSKKVYVSFDIDGLDPSLCPGTGTPVPSGLRFSQATYLMERLAEKHEIIGFDLCEVAGAAKSFDQNVGARLLYKLCVCLLSSQQNC